MDCSWRLVLADWLTWLMIAWMMTSVAWMAVLTCAVLFLSRWKPESTTVSISFKLFGAADGNDSRGLRLRRRHRSRPRHISDSDSDPEHSGEGAYHKDGPGGPGYPAGGGEQQLSEEHAWPAPSTPSAALPLPLLDAVPSPNVQYFEPEPIDLDVPGFPEPCQHRLTTRRGSNGFMRRLTCLQCGEVLAF